MTKSAVQASRGRDPAPAGACCPPRRRADRTRAATAGACRRGGAKATSPTSPSPWRRIAARPRPPMTNMRPLRPAGALTPPCVARRATSPEGGWNGSWAPTPASTRAKRASVSASCRAPSPATAWRAARPRWRASMAKGRGATTCGWWQAGCGWTAGAMTMVGGESGTAPRARRPWTRAIRIVRARWSAPAWRRAVSSAAAGRHERRPIPASARRV